MNIDSWMKQHGFTEIHSDTDKLIDLVSLLYGNGSIFIRFMPIQNVPYFYFWNKDQIEGGQLYQVTLDNLTLVENQL